MKRGVLAAGIVLLLATGALAQQRQHPQRPQRPTPAPPAAPFVPPTLSTGGITTLPPPPPPGPFDARPGTYAPRYNGRSHGIGGGGFVGGGYYDSAAGLVESVTPSTTGVAPHYDPPYVASAAPEKTPAPVPEPPRVVAHGPDTFYVIPGCYAGNHPPNPARLPEGCEMAKLVTHPIH